MQYTSETGVPHLRGRLTKRTLFELPAGIFLVSNCMFRDLTPCIAAELGTRPSREALWIRIREMKLTGTYFLGYRNEAEARKSRVW